MESCPLNEVVVSPVVLDIGAIKSKGLGNINDMRETALLQRSIPQILIDLNLCAKDETFENHGTHMSTPWKIDDPITQQLDALTIFIWDYLRKSGAAGFMLPLSGGADSGLTVAIVFHFANRVIEYLTQRGEEIRKEILTQLRLIVKDDSFDPKNPEEIMNRIFFTRYMGTENSSQETKDRAAKLAEQVGANHQSIDITNIYNSFKQLIKQTMDLDPKFKSEGGAWREDIAL
jgi:NAD+ synthase (glutamine-hydrolysing)